MQPSLCYPVKVLRLTTPFRIPNCLHPPFTLHLTENPLEPCSAHDNPLTQSCLLSHILSNSDTSLHNFSSEYATGAIAISISNWLSCQTPSICSQKLYHLTPHTLGHLLDHPIHTDIQQPGRKKTILSQSNFQWEPSCHLAPCSDRCSAVNKGILDPLNLILAYSIQP